MTVTWMPRHARPIARHRPTGPPPTMATDTGACEVMPELCRDQPQACDFRRHAEPLRRPPVARAATHVHPQMIEPMQPGGERLLEPHEQIPRPELAAVRVTRELQIEARRRGGRCRARLMSEQQLCTCAKRRAREGRAGIAALSRVEHVSAVVRHAG